MHHNFLFDLDQTLLDFHASEEKALKIVITANGLKYTDDCYRHFREYNKALWQELEKGKMLRGVKRSDHQCGGKDQIYGSG